MQDEPIVDTTQAPKGKWWAKISQRPVRRYLYPALGVVPPLLAVVAIVAYPELLRMKAAFVQTHLPLTLPILMVLISIGVRLKDLSSSKGWLALCNYFASGYVTFAIWALVSGQSVKQYIWINDEKVLDKSYSVPLVISAFGLLAVCSLVTVLADAADEKEKGKRGWQVVQALFVGLSLLALLFPYVLFEQKATVEARTGKSLELQAFTVSIGFRDPALNQFLGRSANPLQQCVLYSDIAAKSPENAKAAAFKTFNESDLSNQFLNPADRARDRSTRKKVEVEQAWVVAEVAASGSPGR